MNCLALPRATRVGFGLVLLVALLSFVARVAGAQLAVPADTTAVLRLSLGDAIRMASQQNAAVESARARVDAARSRVTQRRADLLPNVSAAVTERSGTLNSAAAFPIDFPTAPGADPLFDRNGSILGPLNVFDARVRVTQSLYDPAARSRVQGARTAVAAADADVGSVSDLAGATAANAYLAVLRSDAVYTARLADSTLAADLLRIAQAQLSAGTGILLDVTRARSQLTGACTQLILARNDRERTRVDLARAIGSPLLRIEVTDALASLAAPGEATDAAAMLAAESGRKDLQALDLQARSAREVAEAIRKERRPTVGVFADEGISQRNGRSFLSTYDLGIQLGLPIFDGYRREGRAQEQLANARDLDLRQRDLRTQVQADVRNALLNVRSYTEVVVAARERLALAEQEVTQARERFQAGVAGNADVITASLTLNAARTGLVDALTSYQASRVALARAEGSITTLQ